MISKTEEKVHLSLPLYSTPALGDRFEEPTAGTGLMH